MLNMLLLLLLLAIGVNSTSYVESPNQTVVLQTIVSSDSPQILHEEARPAPPTDIMGQDRPNDAGGRTIVSWTKSADDGQGKNSVQEYVVFRSTSIDGEFTEIGTTRKGVQEFVDITTADGVEYYYMIKAFDGELFSEPALSGAITSSAQWFHVGRTNMLIAVLILSFLILWFIQRAKKGEELYIRPIAGLEAVDDAVGRATEMGRPIMYVPGIMDMDNIQTIAGVIILSRVARKAAEYECPILVPTCKSIVMSAAQETVKEAYLDVGRPDAYDADKIRYLTDDQFGYAAGVDGMMMREKPGAVFFMGCFYAESLILAETGHSVGAIQIAGTAQPSQLPFFVTACDYTLIGEELFAASAYLSKQPLLLGSLKGQDWGKGLLIIILIIGIILVSFGFQQVVSWLTVG
jgi:hypothetical protein